MVWRFRTRHFPCHTKCQHRKAFAGSPPYTQVTDSGHIVDSVIGGLRRTAQSASTACPQERSLAAAMMCWRSISGCFARICGMQMVRDGDVSHVVKDCSTPAHVRAAVQTRRGLTGRCWTILEGGNRGVQCCGSVDATRYGDLIGEAAV